MERYLFSLESFNFPSLKYANVHENINERKRKKKMYDNDRDHKTPLVKGKVSQNGIEPGPSDGRHTALNTSLVVQGAGAWDQWADSEHLSEILRTQLLKLKLFLVWLVYTATTSVRRSPSAFVDPHSARQTVDSPVRSVMDLTCRVQGRLLTHL